MEEYQIMYALFYVHMLIFDIIFRLNQAYSLLETQIQILLLKDLTNISLHILLKSLILSCCMNKPISSVKNWLASERPFLIFLFGFSSGWYDDRFITVE